MSDTPPSARTAFSDKYLVALVGLPARGKSYLANKIVNYFSWLNLCTRLFNVGKFRREASSSQKHSADFFSVDNEEGASTREALAMAVLDKLLTWLGARRVWFFSPPRALTD